MKKVELARKLTGYGWWLHREGRRHEVWTNGDLKEAVPRHAELDEYTARSILRRAARNPRARSPATGRDPFGGKA